LHVITWHCIDLSRHPSTQICKPHCDVSLLFLSIWCQPGLCGGYHPLMFLSLGIHTSVSVHYFLYSGRSERRDGNSPDTVASDTSLGRGSCDPKKTILYLHPSSFSFFLFPVLFFFFVGFSKAFDKWGPPTY
jgi:hypothetical protein